MKVSNGVHGYWLVLLNMLRFRQKLKDDYIAVQKRLETLPDNVTENVVVCYIHVSVIWISVLPRVEFPLH